MDGGQPESPRTDARQAKAAGPRVPRNPDSTPQPGGGARVTESYDLSAAPEWLHEATTGGEQWRPAVEASLASLANLVEQAH